MSSSADVPATTYDGVAAAELAGRLGVPRVALFEAVGSTMDVAHVLAGDGAPAGTLVLADTQHVGRGRAGRRWLSPPRSGVWLTIVERPPDADALHVLSLRIGLNAAEALDPLADHRVQVKWPNDLLVAGRKLGGILVEARWRDERPEWVAIGVGVNVRTAEAPEATGLAPSATRLEAVGAIVPAVRAAAASAGALGHDELARYAERDAVRGRWALSPVAGEVLGIGADGRLLLRAAPGGATVALDQATVVYAP